MTEVTQILNLVGQGDATAEDQLLRIVYDELKRIAASKLSHETPGHTLQTTALVNEAYIRLIGSDKPNSEPAIGTSSDNPEPINNERQWDSRGHFFAAAAEAMRRILIDNARRKKRLKRGGDKNRVFIDNLDEAAFDNTTSSVDLESLNEALTRLETASPEKATVVKLRYFAGMTIEQTAEALGISTATVKRNWTFAKAWLQRDMEQS